MFRISQNRFNFFQQRVNGTLLHINTNPTRTFGKFPHAQFFEQTTGQILCLFRMIDHPFMSHVQATLQHILMEIIVQNCTEHFTCKVIDLRIFHPLYAVILDEFSNLLLSHKVKNFRHSLLNDIGHLAVIFGIGKPLSNRQSQVSFLQTFFHNLW